MKAVMVKEGIYWVGAIDWNIRNFHGYLTSQGTTYGAYLIVDEKVTLIDTVKAPFAEEMIERITSVIDPARIDIIITNHVEMDHSGALPCVRKACPNAEVYTSGPSGVRGLELHYGEGGYIPVKSGDSILLGKRTLSFVATPMLHWPDNMVTYCPEEKILFSNDAFGQHLASSQRFDDELQLPNVMDWAKSYYGNIIMCYGKQVKKAWDIIKDMDISMIAPSHGVIWRKNVPEIIEAYRKWSMNEPETGAIVVFDSMWDSTRQIAIRVMEAFLDCDIPARLYDLKENHYSAIIPEILTSRFIAVGSPTLNRQVLPSVAGFLSYMKGLSPGDRDAFAFGSYGWGGESIPLIEQDLKASGFRLCMEGIAVNYVPSYDKKQEIYEAVKDMIKRTLPK